MIEDRFYEICRQNYPIRILTHATYEAKQTLAAKGTFVKKYRFIPCYIFVAILHAERIVFDGSILFVQFTKVSYGLKEKSYKPLPDICPIDFDQFDTKQREELMNKSIRQSVVEAQCKIPKNVSSETFKSRQNIENYLNNLNFHWFQNSLKKFYHGFGLQGNYEKNTLDQPKGIAFIVEVNDKSLKENLDKIKKETDILLKRMYYLNPGCVKAIPIMAVVLFDPNKKYSYQDVKNYTNSLKSDYGIESVLTAKLEINGPSTVDSASWSNYTRPIFTFPYNLTASDSVKFLSQEGMKSLLDIVSIHKERIKKMIENRLEVLFKKYEDNYSVSNKLFGFFKGNTTPKGKYLVTEQAQARQAGDLMFVLEDYKRAHDIYRNILKDFQKRQHSIEMDLRYTLSLCYQMGKFVSIKVNNTTPKSHIEKQAQLFPLYEKLGKKQLTKFLILFLYQIHTFKIFDPNLIKDQYFPMIKRSMNMPDEDRKILDQHPGNRQHFLMPTLLYEQYSNLNLLYQYIDYRRYCYDTVRVSMKFSQYKIYGHALRCLLLVENVYVETFALVEKYVAVHLSSDYVEARNFNQSLNNIKKAWKILAQNTTFHDYNNDTQVLEFKKMASNHGKIMSMFSELSPETLQIPDDKNLIIPYVIQTDIRLSGEEEITETDRTGVTWTEIAEYFNENPQLYTEGYNKAAMEKIFKLFDCTYSEEKELIYRVNCDNISPFMINKNARVSYVKEPIKICFTFYNPFIQEIRITDFQVLIKDGYKNFEMIKNLENENLIIKSRKKVDVCFEIIPHETGLIQFEGLQWVFERMTTKYSFRDIRKVESKLKPFYSIIKIVEPKGKLKVYENSEQELFEGESSISKVTLQNCGVQPITSIYIAFGSHQFYGKKYEKLNIALEPNQKKEITFNLNLSRVPQSIKKDWKLMDKKVFLYKTDGEFRVHRSSILTLINKVLFYKLVCEKLSTHLHLLTFTHESGYQHQTQLESLFIKAGFVISKVDRTQFENTETYYFYLLKDKYMGSEVFNFSTQQRQNNVNNLSLNLERLKKLPHTQSNDHIELVFGWKTDMNRSGLIDMKPVHITPLKQQVLPFLFSTTMPFIIRHNFSKQPVLQKNFDVKIKNIFHTKEIRVKIQLLQENLNGIYWEGVSQRSYRLKHEQEVKFDISFVISKPGVYDISDCLVYHVDIDRHTVPMKHSAHQKLFLHVIDESAFKFAQKNQPDLTSSLNFSESINLGTSTLMFSKKPIEKDNFFMSEPIEKKKSEKQDIMLMGGEDNNLISSPRQSKSPRFSKVVQSDLFGKIEQKSQKSESQSDNLIDLL